MLRYRTQDAHDSVGQIQKVILDTWWHNSMGNLSRLEAYLQSTRSLAYEGQGPAKVSGARAAESLKICAALADKGVKL